MCLAYISESSVMLQSCQAACSVLLSDHHDNRVKAGVAHRQRQPSHKVLTFSSLENTSSAAGDMNKWESEERVLTDRNGRWKDRPLSGLIKKHSRSWKIDCMKHWSIQVITCHSTRLDFKDVFAYEKGYKIVHKSIRKSHSFSEGNKWQNLCWNLEEKIKLKPFWLFSDC